MEYFLVHLAPGCNRAVAGYSKSVHSNENHLPIPNTDNQSDQNMYVRVNNVVIYIRFFSTSLKTESSMEPLISSYASTSYHAVIYSSITDRFIPFDTRCNQTGSQVINMQCPHCPPKWKPVKKTSTNTTISFENNKIIWKQTACSSSSQTFIYLSILCLNWL